MPVIEIGWSPEGAPNLEWVYHLVARGRPELGSHWKSAEKGAGIPLRGVWMAGVGRLPEERRKTSKMFIVGHKKEALIPC